MSTDNDSVSNVNIDKCSVILLDVAGTITSINFVKDTLFSYVTAQVEEFLKTNWDEKQVKEAIKKLQTGDETLDIPTAAKLVKELTEKNSTDEGLKIIQGLIYKKGYESEEIKAHVFDDVLPALEAWSKNKRVAVYSTGSVDSQKLFFSHTVKGDLTSHITKYFDQSVGVKNESSSYEKIAKELEVPPKEVVFITDIVDEANAAKTAGVLSVLITREGNAEIPKDVHKEYTVMSSLSDLPLDNLGKRKIIEEADSSETPPKKVAKTDNEESDVKTVTAPADKKIDVPEKPSSCDNAKSQTAEVEAMEVDDIKSTEPAKQDCDESKNSMHVSEPVSSSAKSTETESKSQTDVSKTDNTETAKTKTDDVVKLGDDTNNENSNKTDKKVNDEIKKVETTEKNNQVEQSEVDKKKQTTEKVKNQTEVDDKKAEVVEENKTRKDNKQTENTVLTSEQVGVTGNKCKDENNKKEVDQPKPDSTEQEIVVEDKTGKKNNTKENVSENKPASEKENSTVVKEENKKEKDVENEKTKEVKEDDKNSTEIAHEVLEKSVQCESTTNEQCDKIVDSKTDVKNDADDAKTNKNSIESVANNTDQKEIGSCDKLDKKIELVNKIESDEKTEAKEIVNDPNTVKESCDKVDDNKTEASDVQTKTANIDATEKSEEKENKSVLANGADSENTNGEATVSNGESEQSTNETKEADKPESTEIKVKQIETNTESAAVSVEV